MTNDTQSGEVARLRAAYLAGFNASTRYWNGLSFSNKKNIPTENAKWCEQRDYDLLSVIESQPTGRTDSERLDWLSKQDVNTGRIGKDDTDEWEFVGIEHYGLTWPHPTDDLRAAIDAAMDSE